MPKIILCLIHKLYNLIEIIDISALYKCILRSLADIDAFQSGRFVEQNGRSKTLKFQPNFAVE